MSFDKLTMGIDIGSTTVKIAIINPDDNNKILFSDYRRHFANIPADNMRYFKGCRQNNR